MSNLDRAIEAMETAESLLLGAYSDAEQRGANGQDPARHEQRELATAVRLQGMATATARTARELAGTVARERAEDIPGEGVGLEHIDGAGSNPQF